MSIVFLWKRLCEPSLLFNNQPLIRTTIYFTHYLFETFRVLNRTDRLLERMDLWAEFMGKVGRKYSLKPSEFIARNVRITPFWNENLPLMIERYGMEEAYIFSTDYPHFDSNFPNVSSNVLKSCSRDTAAKILAGGAGLYGLTDADFQKADKAAVGDKNLVGKLAA